MLRPALVAAVVMLALPASAAASPVPLTLAVRETGCPSGEAYCFSVAAGSTSALSPGAEVHLTFHNTGSMVHEVLVTAGSKGDTTHKATTEDGKLASIEDVPAGGWGNATFTVPNDGSLYFWCGQPGHESVGMWLAVGAPAGKGSPAAPAIVLLGAVLAVAALLRRRA